MPRNNLSGEFHDKFGIFTDSQGKKFNELSYINLGQFFVAYQINKKKKTFDSVYDKNDKHKVQIFSSNDEAINFVKKKSGDYLVKHEFVYQLTYGQMHEIEYDGGRAKQITVPETEMKKIIPFVVSDLIKKIRGDNSLKVRILSSLVFTTKV